MAKRHVVHHEEAVRELRLLLPSRASLPDPGSSAFHRIMTTLASDDPKDESVNRHGGDIAGPLDTWARTHGLTRDPKVAERLRRVRFDLLAALTYPRCPREEFLVAAKWCTWLFFHDDLLCDRQSSHGIESPEKLARVHERLLRILAGEPAKPIDGPLGSALQNLRDDMLRWGGAQWMARFTANVTHHFEANEWEALNRIHDRVPSISTYISMRQHSGAVYTAFDLIELVEDLHIPDETRNHVAIRQILRMANNCICWVNDLFSLAKEIEESNPNNLVIALKSERGLSLADAMRTAVEMHNAELVALQKLISDLPNLTLTLTNDLLDLLAGARSWMRGNLLWSEQTLRYQESLNMLV